MQIKNGKILGEYRTDAAGRIYLENIDPELYVITEVKAPDGYILLTSSKEALVEWGKTTTLQFENQPRNPILVKKVDTKTGEPLAGAKFLIQQVNGAFVAELETGRNGYITVTDLDPSWYTVKETKAPLGYILDDTVKTVELKPDAPAVVEFENQPLNGLHIKKVRVPMGVVGIIYEARPNVTADAFGLCFKTGNAVILKGGRDAFYSNQAITEIIQEALEKGGISQHALQLIAHNDREVTTAFMQLKEYVDVLIPRGGAGLIRSVVENSTIPVIETGTGNCHIYVDEEADLEKAVPIILNAKTQRIGVCNACESLLVHRKIAQKILPALGRALQEKQVEIRGDQTVLDQIPGACPATEEDYGREYLDLILSVKTVDSLEEAIAHINHYNTGHSDAILTENKAHAEKFLREVDSACVYVNASTRFTDGFEFGFGAEIGISTQKLHARGPMGLRELTSYKYQIIGNGQIRQ